jgi:hypothetical protein
MFVQFKLYQFSRSIDFCNMFTGKAIHRFLFDSEPNDRIGRTLSFALRYDPKFVSARVSGKNERMYRIIHREELQYGLEWMIGMWMRYTLRPDGKLPTVEEVEDELTFMAEECSDDDFIPMYRGPEFRESYEEIVLRTPIDWKDVLSRRSFPREDEVFPETAEGRRAYLAHRERIEQIILIPPIPTDEVPF